MEKLSVRLCISANYIHIFITYSGTIILFIKKGRFGSRFMVVSRAVKMVLIMMTASLAAVGTLLTSGLLTTQKSIDSGGAINTVVDPGGGGGGNINIDFFSDSGCTVPLSALTWGSLDPGANDTRTIYIKNSGSVNVTLNCTVSGWNPVEADDFISVTWDRENSVLAPGASVAATFTLTVSQGVVGIESYTMSINVGATQS